MTYDGGVRREPIAPVRAVVTWAHWSADERAAVRASLRGQVAQVRAVDEPAAPGRGPVLVVTSPVVFAWGAVDRLRARAEQSGRVVTRVLVPQAEPTSVALWSAAWLDRSAVRPDLLVEGGLDFDRERLPHGDPQVRAWVRADEIGAQRFTGDRAAALRWAGVEGVRLTVRHGVKTVRHALGPLRRATTLALQRRAHGRRRGHGSPVGGTGPGQVR